MAPAPSTVEGIEDRLARHWNEILGLPPGAPPHGTFFSLGGHSIKATRLIARIHQEFGVRLSMRDVFTHSTVAELAERVAQSEPTGGALPRRRRVVGARRPYEAPLAPAQESFWRAEQALPEAALFNQVMRVEAEGALDPDLLVESLRCVVARHDVLHATFSGAGAMARQAVRPDHELPVVRETHPGVRGDEREKLILHGSRAEAQQPFDLGRNIPVRLRMLEFSPTDRILLVTTHHLVFDGWSRQILAEDLAECYRALAQDCAPPRTPRAGYIDFAEWQHRQRAEGAFAPSVAFWRKELAPPYENLTAGRSSRGPDAYQCARHGVVLETGEAVVRTARTEGVTPFTLLLAVFMATLARLSGATEGRTAIQVANREWPEVQRAVGLFANTLVVRAPFDSAQGFREFLRTVNDAAMRAYVHQAVPFEHVVEELRGTPGMDIARLLQVGFALHQEHGADLPVPGGVIRCSVDDGLVNDEERVDPTTFELVLELRPLGDEFHGSVTYRSDIYPPETIDSFTAAYREVLAAVVADPAAPPAAHHSPVGEEAK